MARFRKELEIKLVGAPADIAALRRSRVVAALATGEGGWERLISTYYDTNEGALARAGVSLRLREENGRRIQTVKRRCGAGTLVRKEDERALKPEEAFPFIPDDQKRAALLSMRGALAPVARTVSDRWTIVLKKKRTRIELGLDLGRLEAVSNDRPIAAAPLAEAELELVEGRAETLFAVARLLVKESRGRLRLGALSKEEAARRLPAGAQAPGADNSFRLDPHDSVGDAYAAALGALAHRLIALAPSISEMRQPEGVHQMRVALRRFRALERVFRETVDDKDLKRLARRARDFARALGPARDWDVFLTETLPPILDEAGGRKGFRKLTAQAEARRARAWMRAVHIIGGVSFALFTLDALKAAHLQRWRAAAGAGTEELAAVFASRALDRRLAAAKAVAARSDPSVPAARHPLRIALKKLRYAAQAFRSLYPRDARKPYMAAMSRLQDGLGALNDAVVAETLANEAALGQGGEVNRAAGFVIGYYAARASAAAANNDEAFAAFDSMTPFWRETESASYAEDPDHPLPRR